MPGNPVVNLGTLNRLVASANFPSFPALNVTPAFMGRRAIRFTPEGDMTTFINVLTGMVTSPEPYIGVTIGLNLIRTQPLVAQWQAQWLFSTLLGDCVIRPDVAASQGGLQPFTLSNSAIMRVADMGFDGEDPITLVTVRATYGINGNLWNG